MHLNQEYVHPSFSSVFTKQTVRQLLKELSTINLFLFMSPNLSADNKRIMANYIIRNISDKRLGALTIAQLTSIAEHKFDRLATSSNHCHWQFGPCRQCAVSRILSFYVTSLRRFTTYY